MAIIVEDISNYKRYFLLGAGLGLFKAVRPSVLGGNLIPHEEEGRIQSIAVGDYKGEILFIESNRLRIIEIDGSKLSDMKDKLRTENSNENHTELADTVCPGCQKKVNLNDIECWNCGLRLK